MVCRSTPVGLPAKAQGCRESDGLGQELLAVAVRDPLNVGQLGLERVHGSAPTGGGCLRNVGYPSGRLAVFGDLL